MFTTNDEEFQEGPERNSLFDQVDEDDDGDDGDGICENCGDDSGAFSLCPECRIADEAFDGEAVAEAQAAAR